MSAVICVLSRNYVKKLEVCQQCFVLLSSVYVMNLKYVRSVVIVPCLCNEV